MVLTRAATSGKLLAGPLTHSSGAERGRARPCPAGQFAQHRDVERCHRGPRGPSGRPSATVEPWPCAQRPTRKRPSPRGHQRRSRKPAQGLPRSSRLVKPNLRRRLPSPRQRINGIGPVVSAMHPRRWDLRHCTIKFVGYSQRLGHGGRALPKGACHRGPLCLQVDKTTLEPLGKLG